MNVIIVSESLWPRGSGGELATYLYAKLLIDEGINVKILLKDGGSLMEWQGLEIYKVNSIGAGKYCRVSPESTRLIEKLFQWAEIIYFTTGLFNLIPLAQHMKKPIVVHIHSYFPLCPVGHMYNFVRGKICEANERCCHTCVWIYESIRGNLIETSASVILSGLFGLKFLGYVLQADAVVFVSKSQQNLFISRLRHMSQYCYTVPRSSVVYNPVQDIGVEPIEADDVCFLGGLDPIKGLHVLLKAWLRLCGKFRNSKLRITKSTGLPSSIKRFNVAQYPRVSYKELKCIFRQSRAAIVPSICPEPAPYAALETLLHGRLLIASNVGGIPELVDGAPGVRLVSPNDINALVDALNWALSIDRNDAIELGLKNREDMLRKFDNRRAVNELIRVFEKVVG